MLSFKSTSALAIPVFALAALTSGGAHAVSTSATVPVALSVVSPTCTVANDNASVLMPTVTSVSQTLSEYYSANSISTTSQGGGGRVTSSAFNQTATISCNLANVAILSFVVKPSASASLNAAGSAQQYMVDAAPTPVKAFGATLSVGTEQLSVNGAAALQYYGSTTPTPYTTAFATGALNAGASTAAVVWRPEFSAPGSTIAGTPTGGSYSGSFDIVVNY